MRTHCCRHKCFPVCPFAQHLLQTQILCPQQMFPSLRSPRNIMGSNVSATMCPRLPGPLHQSRQHKHCTLGHPRKNMAKVRKSISRYTGGCLPVTLGKNNSYCKPFDCAIVLSECTDFFCYLETNSFSFCFLFTHGE